MNRWLAIFLLAAPVLPFIGRRAPAVIGLAILGALGLTAFGYEAASRAEFWAAVCQSPVLLAAAVVRLTGESRAKDEREQKERRQQDAFDDVRRRHAELKEAVSRTERNERLSFQIYGAAKTLAEAVSPAEMAPRLATSIQRIFNAYDFLLYAFEPNGAWTMVQRRGGWTKEPPLSPEASTEIAIVPPPQVDELVAVLVVPIQGSGAGSTGGSGVLYLRPQNLKEPEELLEAAREFGGQISGALAKAVLFNQLEMQSRLDGLTGVLRRQPFMERLTGELKRADVFHTAFSVLMLDIDHFKVINDTHGHAAGDAVLTRVGAILQSAFYETDVVGRYGGEEFIVLLPRAESEGVYRKADALRRRFESEAITSGFEQLHITVSIGLAHFPVGGRTADELIASADRALYQAKETGRNKVVAA